MRVGRRGSEVPRRHPRWRGVPRRPRGHLRLPPRVLLTRRPRRPPRLSGGRDPTDPGRERAAHKRFDHAPHRHHLHGQNCVARAAESGDEPPTIPIVFLKHPSTLVLPMTTYGSRCGHCGRTGRSNSPSWSVPMPVSCSRRNSHWRASVGTPSPTTSPSASFRAPSPVASGPRASVGRTSSRSAPGWPWTRSLTHRCLACARGPTESLARTRTPPT